MNNLRFLRGFNNYDASVPGIFRHNAKLTRIWSQCSRCLNWMGVTARVVGLNSRIPLQLYLLTLLV